jgi:ribosomal protein L11 methyltransferase
MKHIQLEIIANQFQQEELIALLDEYNPSGFEQTDELLKAYFEEKDFAQEEIVKILQGYQYNRAELEEQNWNAVWEQHFQPVVVDDFCGVRAHFHQPILNVQHEIVITPKMSFGTGHHATTYMMMQQMRDIDFAGKSVFDFGTGTGILAILAEKLGAANVVGIDEDDWSIENATENFERNNCRNITVSLTSNLPKEKFDIVLANINRNVILAYMEQLVNIVKVEGLVLFSGLLVADENDIVTAATQYGLQLQKRQERAGWISLLFGR